MAEPMDKLTREVRKMWISYMPQIAKQKPAEIETESYYMGKYEEVAKEAKFYIKIAFLMCAVSVILSFGFCMTAYAEPAQKSITESEYSVLCKCVEAEAGDQSTEGRRAVAEVILNRVDDWEYPNDITSVVYDKGEFAVVANGSIDKVVVTQKTLDAVSAALAKRIYPVDMLWFRTRRYHSWGTPYMHLEDHYFSTR